MLPPHRTVWQQDQAPPSMKADMLSLIDMMQSACSGGKARKHLYSVGLVLQPCTDNLSAEDGF